MIRHHKYLEVNTGRFLKCDCLFWDVMHQRVVMKLESENTLDIH